MKVKDICKAFIEQYDLINSKYPKSFPLFGNLCKKYCSIHNNIDIDEVIDDEVMKFICLMNLVIHLSL